MGFFTRTEMCMTCAGSGDCYDYKGSGYNADGLDHMEHAFPETTFPVTIATRAENVPTVMARADSKSVMKITNKNRRLDEGDKTDQATNGIEHKN